MSVRVNFCPDARFRILFDNCVVGDGVPKRDDTYLDSTILFTCLRAGLFSENPEYLD